MKERPDLTVCDGDGTLRKVANHKKTVDGQPLAIFLISVFLSQPSLADSLSLSAIFSFLLPLFFFTEDKSGKRLSENCENILGELILISADGLEMKRTSQICKLLCRNFFEVKKRICKKKIKKL